jgi:bifunctional DNA-binding transcriptional regulator/antitoxin component of YhaV-PrlF toxin-antitoxin module
VKKLIKVTNRKGQCQITIPIKMARASGVDKVDFVRIELIDGKWLKVILIDWVKKETRTVPGNRS